MRVPAGQVFTGALEFNCQWGSNRSRWMVVRSDNQAVKLGEFVFCSDTRNAKIFLNDSDDHSFGRSTNGRLVIEGKFATRILYNANLCVPT